jgi:hypothetical protein
LTARATSPSSSAGRRVISGVTGVTVRVRSPSLIPVSAPRRSRVQLSRSIARRSTMSATVRRTPRTITNDAAAPASSAAISSTRISMRTEWAWSAAATSVS